MKTKIFYSRSPKLTAKDIPSFSVGDYKCRFLLQTAQGRPVTISQKDDPDMLIWRVQRGFSSLYFGTVAEALDYCRERFCDLTGMKLSKGGES